MMISYIIKLLKKHDLSIDKTIKMSFVVGIEID
jgi:hypothetical protein